MIELQDVDLGYSDHIVLQSVNLSFPKAKLVAIVGPNGSGKSTLLKAVARLIQPSRGSIMVDGRSSETFSKADYAQTIAYLAQGRNIPDMTVEQFVLHGRFPYLTYPRRYSATDRQCAALAMEKMGISELADRSLSSLSGGQRQTVYITMALVQDTEYLLLDEPTTYLDIMHQLQLMHTLRGIANGGKGIVTVMHDLPMALNTCDLVAVLKHGTILSLDTPDVVCKSGVLREVFDIDIVYHEDSGYAYQY